jgi:DNA-binding MarR family transcriptional regulator
VAKLESDISPPPIPGLAKELVSNSGFLLARLGVAFKARALARLDAEGFEAHQYSLLAVLGEGRRQTQAAVAEMLGLDPSRLVALLDSLEERGLVARERDTQDRRRHVVSITPAGRRQLQRLRVVAKKLEDELLAPLTPQDRVAFHELLVQLTNAYDACAPAPSASSKPA